MKRRRTRKNKKKEEDEDNNNIIIIIIMRGRGRSGTKKRQHYCKVKQFKYMCLLCFTYLALYGNIYYYLRSVHTNIIIIM